MLAQVKKDLKAIKCYYSQLREIDIVSETVSYDGFKQKVELYNQAINIATPILYRVYTSIYVEGLSLEETAEEIDKSYKTVVRKNKELREYFIEYFKKNNIDIFNL